MFLCVFIGWRVCKSEKYSYFWEESAHLSLSHGQYNLWLDKKVYAHMPSRVLGDVSLRYDLIHVNTSRSFSP